MFTVLSNTRNANLYIIVALATVLVVILTFAVAPSIAAPQPVIIPETGSQNAYVEFLRGEKALYATPDLSWPSRPDFSHPREKNVAPSSYRSPTDECFDVTLSELVQCRNESEAPSQ